MKKLLLFLILLGVNIYASGQCSPDTSITHNVPGIYPDTLVNLSHAAVGQAYAADIQFKIVTTVLYQGFNVPIDSVVIQSVGGLPSGFNYSCTPSNCNFPGGSSGCIYLYGAAPTALMIGSYPITVNITGYGRLATIPIHVDSVIPGYKIVIDSTTGISGVERVDFFAGQNMPNPARSFTSIPVSLPHPDEVSVKVSNLLGKEISTRIYNLQRGKNNIQLDVHGLQPGIYLYSVTNGKNTVTRRMIISND